VVCALGVLALVSLIRPIAPRASTYAVYIPLDSPVYEELATLNGLGYLDTYLDEIKPISRVEAARLTLEAGRNLDAARDRQEALARRIVTALRAQFRDEIGWLERDAEDNPPTTFHPVERVEAGYLFSRGEQREWRTSVIGKPGDGGINAEEATPLLPYDDALPTAAGSNEIVRVSGWAGLGGFFTVYAEGASSGPLTRGIQDNGRLQLLGTAAVLSYGDWAFSVGTEEMRWGAGYFGALSQDNAASPFPAIRWQNIHPTLLPGFLRYLGQFRFQMFFGQLNSERYFSHPWIDGQIFSFKPLPHFEFGFTHAITFGGTHNDNYSPGGFVGRATGFATGTAASGNTNSRGGIYLKFFIPKLRNLEVYQEILGEDNLTNEITGVGRFLPFLAVSYQGGCYLPRLTRDGLTDLRFEFAILEPNYSTHGDSLYWTYDGQLMGDGLGPNATEVDLQMGRWLALSDKVAIDAFYTEQAPHQGSGANTGYPARFYPYPLGKEHSYGAAIDLMRLPEELPGRRLGLGSLSARAAVEYAQDLNFRDHSHTVRLLLMVSGALEPGFLSWTAR
jgi:hypothetical protein